MEFEPTASIIGILGTIVLLVFGCFVLQDWPWWIYVLGVPLGFFGFRNGYIESKKRDFDKAKIKNYEEKIREYEERIERQKSNIESSEK